MRRRLMIGSGVAAVLVVMAIVMNSTRQDQPIGRAIGFQPDGQGEFTDRPNVIVILADDLGWADTSTFNSQGGVSTPNLDALAAAGVKFNAAYTSAPTCGPSRAGLLTGRTQQRFGFEFNPGNSNDAHELGRGLPTSELTMGEAMQEAGYHTGMVGKWHLGSTDELYPTSRGFDFFYGLLSGATTFVHPGTPGVTSVETEHFKLGSGTKAHAGGAKNQRYGFDQIIRGRNRLVDPTFDVHLTDQFTARAVQYIERNSDAPFFLYLAHTAPHLPFQALDRHVDLHADIEDPVLRVYSAMISHLDEAVGEVMDTLDALGLTDNTLVFFVSDNGCATYTNICACEPIRGGKSSHMEGGLRVPMIASWPGHIPAGKVVDYAVSTLDIFPTSLLAGGGLLPDDRTYDGVDLVPYLDGTNTAEPHPTMFWRSGVQRTVLEGDFKLRLTDREVSHNLHNLAADPMELVNVAGQGTTIASLESKLSAWESELVEPMWPPSTIDTMMHCGEEVPFTP